MKLFLLLSFKKFNGGDRVLDVDLFKTSSYSFELPDHLIASEPLRHRDQSRLLVVNRRSKSLEHRSMVEMPSILDPQTEIVVNNTRVFKARLKGERIGTGGRVEFFLLTRLGQKRFQGLMKTGSKISPGFRFRVQDPKGEWIEAEVISRLDSVSGALFTADFSLDPIEREAGEVPLPPYIVQKRESLQQSSQRPDELETYNTIFSKEEGSVAAPTAGRHFTDTLIQKLKNQGIGWSEITLHVGLGTFKPVGTKDLRDHVMHEEWTSVSETIATTLTKARQQHRTILAVGTTSARTLEGRAVKQGASWGLRAGDEAVNLFIHPGMNYEWKWVDALLTNFHLPESTLLMMVASRIGDLDFTLHAYREAVREGYRFYSYGDAMLVLDR